MSITFAAAKTRFSSYGATVGDQINFVLERALEGGKWNGTIATVRATVYDYDNAGVTKRQFTLPRDAETALGIRFDNLNQDGRTSPRPIHNHWYTWLPGRCCGEWSSGIVDLGDFQTFRDVPANAMLRIRTDYVESGTFYIRGTGSNGLPIYSGTPPSVIEGTSLNLATNPATTSETFLAGAPIQIVKPVTQGPVRLYSWDGTTETLIATYAPGEKVPAWRRYQMPTSSTWATVLVKAKRRFVEMIADNDVVFMSGTALFYGLRGYNYDQKHDDTKADLYWGKFWDCLNDALREHQGNMPLVMPLRRGEGFGTLRQRE